MRRVAIAGAAVVSAICEGLVFTVVVLATAVMVSAIVQQLFL